jgi:sigma-B regulation protein RsbQ
MAEKLHRLHGTISGTQGRTVILGHGFGTDQTAWNLVRPWLEARFRVVSFDMAGAGPDGAKNYNARRYGSLFAYADDLLDIIDELELENLIYIGHSVGCMIGVAAAVARPDPFRNLLLIAGSPRYLNEPGYAGGFEQYELDAVYDDMAANFQAWAAGFAPMVVGVSDKPAVDEFFRTLFLMRPDIALNTCRTIFQSDMREIVPRLERPAHIVQTQRDMAVPLSVAQWLHGNIERSTLDIIDAAGHTPHLTAPDQIIAMFERHLAPMAAHA